MFGGISEAFDVHNKLVTFGVNSDNYITLAFAGGGTMQLQGFSSAEATAITNTFNALVVLVLTAQLTSVTHSRSRPSADLIALQDLSLISNPLFGGFFMLSSDDDLSFATIHLLPWQKAFYAGDRLRAEVQLLGSAFVGQTSHHDLVVGYSLLQVSHGQANPASSVSPCRSFKHPCLIRNSLLTVAMISPTALVRMP